MDIFPSILLQGHVSQYISIPQSLQAIWLCGAQRRAAWILLLETPSARILICNIQIQSALRPESKPQILRVRSRTRSFDRFVTRNGRYHSIRATCIMNFLFFRKNHSGPFIHITWYHLNCQKTSKGAPFRGF